jgi:hypothetical protein
MPEALPQDVYEAIVRMYVDERLGAPSIAATLGLGRTTVYSALRRNGVQRDQKTRRAGRSGVRRFEDDVEQEIARKYAAGRSRASLEEEYSCSGYPIRKAITEYGGVMRSRGNHVRAFTDDQIELMRVMIRNHASRAEVSAFCRKDGDDRQCLPSAWYLHA